MIPWGRIRGAIRDRTSDEGSGDDGGGAPTCFEYANLCRHPRLGALTFFAFFNVLTLPVFGIVINA